MQFYLINLKWFIVIIPVFLNTQLNTCTLETNIQPWLIFKPIEISTNYVIALFIIFIVKRIKQEIITKTRPVS